MSTKNEVKMPCLRCGEDMVFMGTKKFPEGTDWSNWIGEWGTLLNRKESFDVLGCTNCGKIEFFYKNVMKAYQKMKDDEQ